MKPVVSPPWQIQQRAWECSHVMRDHYADIPLEHRVQIEVVYRTHPEGLGWREIARMFVLYRELMGERV